ncbi:MAG: radical SAM protein [Aphanocapsa lilacina HA4352-LM1]|jgi:MoaA/NifB/PqqE/SkfB family radical SAM enzyme|nr:radical SAM protein [Aphanocapsa lilacina HA4352-LM1]
MAPLVCNYYVTYKCNARCHFCDIWALTPPPESSYGTICANLRDLRRLGVKYVDFTGGEPLLRPDIVELYAEAKRLGLMTTLTTNTILYPKKAEALRGLVDFLNFSLDGPDAASHNQSRGVDIFERLVESVHLARALGEYPTLNFTVTAQNFARIGEVAELARRLEVRVWLNPAFTAHEHYNSAKNPTPEIVAAIRGAAERYRGTVGYNRAALALIEAGGNDTTKPRCKAVDAVIVISPDDKLLLPCYHFAQHAAPIGGRLYDLYTEGEKVQEYRTSQGKLKVCEGCTVWCYLIPSFFKGLDRYTLLNGFTYADEFFARRRGRRGVAV